MQATEVSERRTPLSVVYEVVVPAAELEDRVMERLKGARAGVKLKGFRPGHVPVPHLRKIYGKQVIAEVIDAAVRDANAKLVKDNRLRTTEEPKVLLPTDEKALTALMAGKADLTYTVEMDVIPAIELMDFTTLRLERKYTEISEEVVDKALEAMATMSRGPKAPDATEEPPPPAIDDAFAKGLGFETLEKLRNHIWERAQIEAALAARGRLKRALLDVLAGAHRFEVPRALVELEFKTVWKAVTGDLEQHKQTWEAIGTTEDDARATYLEITERRVRLGFIITEIGERERIRVDDKETEAAIADHARRQPDAASAANVVEHYKREPVAIAGLRAPLFEEKVVDWILARATVVDVLVSRDELLRDD